MTITIHVQSLLLWVGICAIILSVAVEALGSKSNNSTGCGGGCVGPLILFIGIIILAIALGMKIGAPS